VLNKNWIRKRILQYSRVMMIFTVARANHHPKSHVGDLQTFYQELKSL
jgi:hypothetical protein